MAQPANHSTTRLGPPEGIGALRRQRLEWARVYFVCDAEPHGSDPEPLVRAAFVGGTAMVELRESELRRPALDRIAETFRRLADIYGALFIFNDDPYAARDLAADGVHVGQDDIDPAEARRVLGPDAIIGLSTHSIDQIEAANEMGVDYISVGPIWETPSKEGRPATGLELIRSAADVAQVPWFAIGGIDPSNVDEVVGVGAERVCVIRAIRDAEDPAAAARSLSEAVDPTARTDG